MGFHVIFIFPEEEKQSHILNTPLEHTLVAGQFLLLRGLAQTRNNTVADSLMPGNRKNKREREREREVHGFLRPSLPACLAIHNPPNPIPKAAVL